MSVNTDEILIFIEDFNALKGLKKLEFV